jgi:hypothetical protein
MMNWSRGAAVRIIVINVRRRIFVMWLLVALFVALAVVGITVGGTVQDVTIGISAAILVVQVVFLIRQLMRRSSVAG